MFKDGIRIVTESGSSSRYFSNAETKDLFTLGPQGTSHVLCCRVLSHCVCFVLVYVWRNVVDIENNGWLTFWWTFNSVSFHSQAVRQVQTSAARVVGCCIYSTPNVLLTTHSPFLFIPIFKKQIRYSVILHIPITHLYTTPPLPPLLFLTPRRTDSPLLCQAPDSSLPTHHASHVQIRVRSWSGCGSWWGLNWKVTKTQAEICPR